MGKNSIVDKTTVIQTVQRRLQKMAIGDSLTLLTWKKDRSVRLTLLENGNIEAHESGFVAQTILVRPDRLRKVLKTLLKREFPRSHKIRLKMN